MTNMDSEHEYVLLYNMDGEIIDNYTNNDTIHISKEQGTLNTHKFGNTFDFNKVVVLKIENPVNKEYVMDKIESETNRDKYIPKPIKEVEKIDDNIYEDDNLIYDYIDDVYINFSIFCIPFIALSTSIFTFF